jgi:hypothetical protein
MIRSASAKVKHRVGFFWGKRALEASKQAGGVQEVTFKGLAQGEKRRQGGRGSIAVSFGEEHFIDKVSGVELLCAGVGVTAVFEEVDGAVEHFPDE